MFTKEELKNLQVFLNRANLSGVEVPVFVGLMNKISMQIEQPEPTEE